MPDAKRCAGLLLGALCLCSCGSEQQGARKETFAMTGQVLVDGSPAERIAVTCHDVNGTVTETSPLPQAYTDKDGKFRISSYKADDGVPEGDYVLTFTWADLDMMTMRNGPDKFNDRYNDPKKSDVKISIKKGIANEPRKIELTSK